MLLPLIFIYVIINRHHRKSDMYIDETVIFGRFGFDRSHANQEVEGTGDQHKTEIDINYDLMIGVVGPRKGKHRYTRHV